MAALADIDGGEAAAGGEGLYEKRWVDLLADSTDCDSADLSSEAGSASCSGDEAAGWRAAPAAERPGAPWRWELEGISRRRGMWFLATWRVARESSAFEDQRWADIEAEPPTEILELWSTADDLLEVDGGARRLGAFRRGDDRRRAAAEAERSRRSAEARARREAAHPEAANRAAARRAIAASRREEAAMLRRALLQDAALRRAALYDPAGLLPNFAKQIVHRFAAVNCRVLSIENICMRHLALPFVASFGEEPLDMVFHGTRSCNLAGIIGQGLCVPGTNGVTVANGSAYGVGIYTARSPQVGYARDFQHLPDRTTQFVCCAGRTHGRIRDVCGYRIFFDAAFVLPCFLVTVRQGPEPETAAAPAPAYCPRIMSELPVQARKADGSEWMVYPQAESVLPTEVARRQRAAPTGGFCRVLGRRVIYAARMDADRLASVDGAARVVWYDRERRAVSARHLRAEPRSVKAAARAGLLPQRRGGAGRRARDAETRRREVAVARARRGREAALMGPPDLLA